MTSETRFAQSPSIEFLSISLKWKLDVRLEVPTSLEINFSTIEVGLHCSFHPEKLAYITACWVKHPTLQRTDETLQLNTD